MQKINFPILTLVFLIQSVGCSVQSAGIITDGKIKFNSSESVILIKWNDMLKQNTELDAQLNRIELMETDEGTYLVAKGEEYSSIILLEIDDHTGSFKVGGVTCTSKDCSSSETECIPRSSGKSCTPCKGGDCTKSVSNNRFAAIFNKE